MGPFFWVLFCLIWGGPKISVGGVDEVWDEGWLFWDGSFKGLKNIGGGPISSLGLSAVFFVIFSSSGSNLKVGLDGCWACFYYGIWGT